MARITIAALQAQIAELEAAQRGLVETIDDLRQQVAERDTLRARIDTGIAAYKTARAEIARLTEIVANKRVVFVKPQREAAPVITRFYRGGKLWEKTRVGNVATERLVEVA